MELYSVHHNAAADLNVRSAFSQSQVKKSCNRHVTLTLTLVMISVKLRALPSVRGELLSA